MGAMRRLRQRNVLHARIRQVLRAWPVAWQEIEIGPGVDMTEFRVGDAQAGFRLWVLYPDEREREIAPGVILTCSVTDVVQACQRNLR